MTFGLRGPLSLALLQEANARGTAVQDRLGTMPHRVTEFASAAALLTALGNGRRFDLILLASWDEVTHKGLHAACEVLGMPMLVVPPGEPWKGLPMYNDVLLQGPPAAPSEPPAQALLHTKMVRGAYRFIDDASGTVCLRDREIYLPPQCFAFASALFQNADTVLTREWLWNAIWKAPPERVVGRVIDVCAANVRKKLALEVDNGFVLRAIYGCGYKLVTVAPRHTAAPVSEAPAL
ncbi:transcriptional regulator [Variovorax sp. 54]|uniref:winged helix-turn-helix domain-containing protein n=1 Tax=Variovorax sp. 54 TaxID=2035212 RepID=UPI000C40C554|nr:winged helix-turn-helix domain-containing protein [Variovorax sp. 54]PIF77221.1 transcriptional regulator [Variovorax sp. 54]